MKPVWQRLKYVSVVYYDKIENLSLVVGVVIFKVACSVGVTKRFQMIE